VTAFVILIVIAFLFMKAARGPSAYDRLAARGIPGLAIVLGVSPTGGPPFRWWLKRPMLLDVEVPGQDPYEANVVAGFPVSMRGDVLPGATVEVRVHPKNRKKIVIVGPGAGFTGTFPRKAP
jgi:hypothetical protein